MKLRFLAVLVTAVLAACTSPKQVPDGFSPKSVAIAVSLKEQLYLRWIGFTVFNNTDETVAVDWKMQAHLLRSLQQNLTNRYEVRQVPDGVSTALAVTAAKSPILGAEQELSQTLKAKASPGLADVIIVAYSPDGASYQAPRQIPPGAEISFRVSLFDGRTFEPIAAKFAEIKETREFKIFPRRFPRKEMDIAWRGEEFSAISENDKKKIQTAIYDLIDESIPFTLDQMKFLSAPQ